MASTRGSTRCSGGSGSGDGDTGDGDGGGCAETGDGDIGDCQAPAEHVPCDTFGSDPTWTQVLGLDCPGTSNNSVQTTANSFTNADPLAYAAVTQFGSSGDWVPTEGEMAMVITTGQLAAVDGSGVLINPTGSAQSGTNNDNPDGQQLPSPMTPTPGWTPPSPPGSARPIWPRARRARSWQPSSAR